jgi:hypothetical protein
LIPIREPFRDTLDKEIAAASSVVVLWSMHSIRSEFVLDEASAGHKLHLLFPVLIDDVRPPLGLRGIQTCRLIGWDGDEAHPEFVRLNNDLKKVVGQPKPHISLAAPDSTGPITDEHMTLVHSSWRVPERDAEFLGNKMYQIHVIVYASESVLGRTRKVRYVLDAAYPEPVKEIADRDRFFEFKELANGYSVVRAEVFVDGEVKPVVLQRFINLTETGPRLESEFMRR